METGSQGAVADVAPKLHAVKLNGLDHTIRFLTRGRYGIGQRRDTQNAPARNLGFTLGIGGRAGVEHHGVGRIVGQTT